MNQKHWLGKKGENLAVSFLEGKGYSILEQNWRIRKAEIDIIAQKEGVLVFVEVKTKSYSFYGAPEEGITQRKEELLVFGAFEYAQKIKHEGEIRFDIISILFKPEENPVIRHFYDVLEPGL